MLKYLIKIIIFLITEAIELLRHEKPFEGAIGLLTAFYDKTDDFSVRKTIAGFMNDLKGSGSMQGGN